MSELSRRELVAQTSRTFRIFVSSTFSDLKEERNTLQKHVFPKLRELCMQHGCRFQAIDLRWGVRKEASLDQQTMRICTEEIQRCQRVTPRPNFIMLLGDRYGWQPPPYEIPAEEFVEIERLISDADKEQLSYWYRRDENAVPPVYCLQPRTGEFAHYEKWEVVEHRLHDILLQSIARMELPAEERVKYTASATEQEIVQGLKAPKSDEHVFCFFRTVKDLPQDASAKDFIDLDEIGNLDEDANAKLKDLKDKLRSLLPGNIYEYKAAWADRGLTTEHIDKLCEDVYNSLARIINKEIAKLEEIDPLDKEIADHSAFGSDRAKFFIGRAAILQTMSNYVKGADNHPLAVFGESGSGKSALMAKAVEIIKREQPKAVVISRFIGATPSSTDIQSLLESLCREIYTVFDFDNQKRRRLAEIGGESEGARKKREEIEEEYSIPSDIQKLPLTFYKFLNKIPRNKNLFLFLGALDQLSDTNNARNLIWLPAELPEHVRMIVSTLPGESLSVLEKKLPAANIVELDPMHLKEGSALLDAWLKDADRALQKYQREEVLSKFRKNRLPLYLKLAFEEARRWKSYTEKIELSPDIQGIIRDLFARISSDANHGATMVSRSLGYLAAAKNGLTEDELLDVLSSDEVVFQDFIKRAYHKPPEKRLPVIVWSRLYFDLEPYLTKRSADGTTLLTFYHRQLGEVVAEDFLVGKAKRKRHMGLARYFDRQPLWLEKKDRKTANLRKVSELPYQQTYGELWDEIEQTLCYLHFIEAKCAAGMTYDLIADYNAALYALPDAQREKQKELKHEKRIRKYTEDLIAFARREISFLEIIPSVEPWSEEKIREDAERIRNNPQRLDRMRAFSQFVNSESHALVKFASHHGFCIQQAYNSASSGPVASAAEKIVNKESNGVLLLEVPSQRPAYDPHPARIRTLEGHTNYVGALSITPDGKRAVSGSIDHTLRVWDLETGECLRTLYIQPNVVEDVCITPDGKKAVTAEKNHRAHYLRMWDLETGACLKTLPGDTDRVTNVSITRGTSVSITPDGKRAISGSWSDLFSKDSRHGTMRLWDLETGECLKTLRGHVGRVTSVSITPDGKRAISASEDCTVRLWDLERGESLRTLEGHTGPVICGSFALDGKRAISGSANLEIRVWNLETGECVRTINGQPRNVGNSISFTADGKKAVSGSWDHILRLWDLETGECLRTFDAQPVVVNNVCVTADGKRVVSTGGPLILWDLERGQLLRKVDGHAREVLSADVTIDGKRAISGSADMTVRVWDFESGECLRMYEGHTKAVDNVSITTDGKRVISSSSVDATLRIWDLETGICIRKLYTWPHIVLPLMITPDGKRVISLSQNRLSNDKTLRLWDLESGKCIKILEGHTDSVNSVSISPDGKQAVSGSDDKTLRLWDLESGKCIKILEGHTDSVTGVSITPDGTRVASASDDRTVRLWDMERGECLRTLEGHTQWVYWVRVTPHGNRALSASSDKTLRLWDLQSGNCIRTLDAPTENVINGVKITYDGKRAISGIGDSTVHVWDLESGECIAIYYTETKVNDISQVRTSGCFAYVTSALQPTLLKPRNFPMAPPQVTPIRIWRYGTDQNDGHLDNALKAVCLWCGQCFPVAEEILDTITSITREANLLPNQSPCLKLPDEAWENTCLLSECPHCHKPLRFNPFVVDNAQKKRAEGRLQKNNKKKNGMGKKTVRLKNGLEVEVKDVDFETMKEDWGEYKLEDGTVLEFKTVVSNIVRTEQYDPMTGDPVYHVRTQNVLRVNVPEELKQQNKNKPDTGKKTVLRLKNGHEGEAIGKPIKLEDMKRIWGK